MNNFLKNKCVCHINNIKKWPEKQLKKQNQTIETTIINAPMFIALRLGPQILFMCLLDVYSTFPPETESSAHTIFFSIFYS